MDPNAALARIRKLVERTLAKEGDWPSSDEFLDLAETINSLDKWLSECGFLPRAWQDGR